LINNFGWRVGVGEGVMDKGELVMDTVGVEVDVGISVGEMEDVGMGMRVGVEVLVGVGVVD